MKEKERRRRRRRGLREIIIGRGMCYPQGLLLIASLMVSWDVLVGYWIWIQLCRLRGVGILAHQTTAQFDMNFFFPLPSSQPLQLASPRGFPPIRSSLAVMDWHPVSVKLLYGSLMRRSGGWRLHCYCHYLCLNRKSKQVKLHYSYCCQCLSSVAKLVPYKNKHSCTHIFSICIFQFASSHMFIFVKWTITSRDVEMQFLFSWSFWNSNSIKVNHTTFRDYILLFPFK